LDPHSLSLSLAFFFFRAPSRTLSQLDDDQPRMSKLETTQKKEGKNETSKKKRKKFGKTE